MASPTALPERDSTYQIRASVLDAALELGLADGGVADWLLNPHKRVDEDESDEVRVRSFVPLRISQ